MISKVAPSGGGSMKIKVQLNYKTKQYELKQKDQDLLKEKNMLEYVQGILDDATKVSTFEQYYEKSQELEALMGSDMMCKLTCSGILMGFLIGLPCFLYYMCQVSKAVKIGNQAKSLYIAYNLQINQEIKKREQQYEQFKNFVEFSWKRGAVIRTSAGAYLHETGQFEICDYDPNDTPEQRAFDMVLQQQQQAILQQATQNNNNALMMQQQQNNNMMMTNQNASYAAMMQPAQPQNQQQQSYF